MVKIIRFHYKPNKRKEKERRGEKNNKCIAVLTAREPNVLEPGSISLESLLQANTTRPGVSLRSSVDILFNYVNACFDAPEIRDTYLDVVAEFEEF